LEKISECNDSLSRYFSILISLNQIMLYFNAFTLRKCSSHVKANEYLTIVRPLLEYAACVWDPYQEYLIYDFQWCAARWDYNYYSMVKLP